MSKSTLAEVKMALKKKVSTVLVLRVLCRNWVYMGELGKLGLVEERECVTGTGNNGKSTHQHRTTHHTEREERH